MPNSTMTSDNATVAEGNYVFATTTPEPPLTLQLWGLLFIFLVIILITVLCITCMILLVLFGCMKSFLCIRCRRNESDTT